MLIYAIYTWYSVLKRG